MAGGKLISTGVEFPDATTQTTSALPLTGGTMTGTIAGFTSTGIDDNATSTAITITDTKTTVSGVDIKSTNTNVGVGVGALGSITSGYFNTAIGKNAHATNQTGIYNTAVGYHALYLATGHYNTALGMEAGDNITTGTANIIIGRGVDAPSATASNQLNIGGWIKGVDGAITMPSQPAFSAYINAIQYNLGVGLYVDLQFNAETFDQGNDFNTGTYEFTAPVTGKYQLQVYTRMSAIDTAAAYTRINIATSNRTYNTIDDPNYTSDLSYHTQKIMVLADMDAGDTAKVQFYQSGGSAIADAINGVNSSNFSGYLVA